jgi:hypothetical protein
MFGIDGKLEGKEPGAAHNNKQDDAVYVVHLDKTELFQPDGVSECRIDRPF